MADPHQTTIVGRWLLANKELRNTRKLFFDKGYKELPEVTEEAVSAIVSDDPSMAKKLSESVQKN